MRIILPFLFVLAFSLPLSAQNFEKVSFGEGDDDYYLAVKPQGQILGTVVLMPGFGQTPESIFPESKIQNVAYNRGIMTIAIAGGQKLHCDASVISKLERGLSHAIEKYDLDKRLLVMGGFSAGGTISLRYAELCHEKPDEFPIVPKAVFTVDSPVDLVGIWEYFQRELKKDFSEAGVNEAKFVSELMLREIGHPKTEPLKYMRLSPFSRSAQPPGNERFLKGIPVRTYHDIDVTWLVKQRGRSLYDSNSLDASELISRLFLMGNDHAEFIISKTPGMRSNGLRHPHSWSIVDEVEFMDWVLMALRR